MLTNAVRAYNRAVDRMTASGLYTDVPLRTTVGRERELLSDPSFDRHQLYNRVRDLRRATPSVNPRAVDPVNVVVNGTEKVIPKYLDQMLKQTVRTVNQRRIELRRRVYPDWAKMSRVEQLTHMSGKNLDEIPTHTEQDMGRYLDDVLREKFLANSKYFDNYLTQWSEHSAGHAGFSTVVSIIRDLADNNPDALNAILEADYDETKLEYIYPTSAYPEEFGVRQNRVVRFWETMASKYSASAEPYAGWSGYEWSYDED